MAHHTPSFLFHIPHMGNKVLTAEELRKRMGTMRQPQAVHVIDATTHSRLGSMHPSLALMKFR